MIALDQEITNVKNTLSDALTLGHDALPNLPERVVKPMFDRSELQTGILHLGCGNFHRAHQALATQAAIEEQGSEGLRWGIASVSMRRRATSDLLNNQDCLYTVLEKGPSESRAIVAGSIREAIFAPDELGGLHRRLADPAISLVTLTVTANGYHLRPSTGRLNLEHPEVARDLEGTLAPTTAVGVLARGLEERRSAGGVPPVILSCDNLSSNGETLRQAVLDFTATNDDALSDWIARNVQFPNSMVDRIVPATMSEDIAEAGKLLGGLHDQVPVPTEPWTRWIIENFDGDRPAWEAGGAEFVGDVRSFEMAKLRMLNGVHMFLAYVGLLDGKSTIADAAGDAVIGALAAKFMLEEQGASVVLSSASKKQYAVNLMNRFRNPGIVHKLGRISRNASTKLATRVLEPMRENIMAGRDVRGATLLIASWIRCVTLKEQANLPVDLSDPRAERLYRILRKNRNSFTGQSEAFLAMEEVFGPRLPEHQRVVQNVASTLEKLSRRPVHEVLAEALL